MDDRPRDPGADRLDRWDLAPCSAGAVQPLPKRERSRARTHSSVLLFLGDAQRHAWHELLAQDGAVGSAVRGRADRRMGMLWLA